MTRPELEEIIARDYAEQDSRPLIPDGVVWTGLAVIAAFVVGVVALADLAGPDWAWVLVGVAIVVGILRR